MFFLNLTAVEFFALLGAAASVITALYMLDRTRRRRVVSTLRFWPSGNAVQPRKARRRVNDPWSLVLQLLSLLLLLLAAAQLEWGVRDRKGRDDVLLLDTSAWSGARDARGSSVLDQEKRSVERYLSALSRNDRVLLVGVDSLAAPLTRFTADRSSVLAELSRTRSGYSALNVSRALVFAREAINWSRNPGEIVYFGPAIADAEEQATAPNLRLITVPVDWDNLGIRQLAAKQADDNSDTWQAVVRVANSGAAQRIAHIRTRFGNSVFEPRTITIPGHGEQAVSYIFVTHSGGPLAVEIDPGGSLASDDRVTVQLPRLAPVKISVFTERPGVLKPLFDSSPGITAEFLAPSQYANAGARDAGVLLFDRFCPPQPSSLPALYIDPPRQRSPLPVSSVAANTTLHWIRNAEAGFDVKAKPLLLPSAKAFQIFKGDTAAAAIPEGPTVVLRAGDASHAKLAAVGFDPFEGELQFETATPLLFADLLQWLKPEAFRSVDVQAVRAGSATLKLDGGEARDQFKVTDRDGVGLPYNLRDDAVRIYVADPSIVHIDSREREHVLSVTLPDVATHQWRPNARSGYPLAARILPAAVDLWKWLAALGGLCLLAEWMLWGRGVRARRRTPETSFAARQAETRELVNQ